MSIYIVVGAIIGTAFHTAVTKLASNSHFNLWLCILIGVMGAFAGLLLSDLANIHLFGNVTDSLIFSSLGSLLLLTLNSLIRRNKPIPENIEEIRISLPAITLSALRIVNGSKHRILCTHGWLDNANSFLPLLPLIENAEIVALDLPGHGSSDHLNAPYNIPATAHYVVEAAKQLKWDSYSLIGHSLGGCIAPFASAVAQDQIENIVFIEGLGPKTEPTENLINRLQLFNEDMSALPDRSNRILDSIDQAVESRLRANKMHKSSARLLAERQLNTIQTDAGEKWQWSFDIGLRVASPTYFTEEQVLAILKAVTCKSLCIVAHDGFLTKRPNTESRLSCLPDNQTVWLDGNHHLHMDNPQAVAEHINNFFS